MRSYLCGVCSERSKLVVVAACSKQSCSHNVPMHWTPDACSAYSLNIFKSRIPDVVQMRSPKSQNIHHDPIHDSSPLHLPTPMSQMQVLAVLTGGQVLRRRPPRSCAHTPPHKGPSLDLRPWLCTSKQDLNPSFKVLCPLAQVPNRGRVGPP
jgi:hypothetical protein